SGSILCEKQAHEIAIKAPLQLIAAGPSSHAYRQAVGAAANATVTIGHWAPKREDRPKAKKCTDARAARHNTEHDYGNESLTYLSIEILEQAVAKAGLDKEKLREVISTETFSTINGNIKFDGVQNTITPVAFLQIQDGSLELVWPDSLATSSWKPKTQ